MYDPLPQTKNNRSKDDYIHKHRWGTIYAEEEYLPNNERRDEETPQECVVAAIKDDLQYDNGMAEGRGEGAIRGVPQDEHR